MSATGYCYDNATCESFFATLKNEAFPEDQVFHSRREANLAIFEYIETFSTAAVSTPPSATRARRNSLRNTPFQ